jgi:hypothetical protein
MRLEKHDHARRRGSIVLVLVLVLVLGRYNPRKPPRRAA